MCPVSCPSQQPQDTESHTPAAVACQCVQNTEQRWKCHPTIYAGKRNTLCPFSRSGDRLGKSGSPRWPPAWLSLRAKGSEHGKVQLSRCHKPALWSTPIPTAVLWPHEPSEGTGRLPSCPEQMRAGAAPQPKPSPLPLPLPGGDTLEPGVCWACGVGQLCSGRRLGGGVH